MFPASTGLQPNHPPNPHGNTNLCLVILEENENPRGQHFGPDKIQYASKYEIVGVVKDLRSMIYDCRVGAARLPAQRGTHVLATIGRELRNLSHDALPGSPVARKMIGRSISMGKHDLSERVNRFWLRVTEGMQLNQLWSQFRTDAHSSYRLYSLEVDSTRVEGVDHTRHFLSVGSQFFWAIVEKLTPARRVLLLVALVLVFVPGGEWTWRTRSGTVEVFGLDFHFYGGLLMFVLLVLEVADRVVMKRDLQIAKEIQTWLLPESPPHVPGLEIAFTTRPANTVAGDYYDVFARPSEGSASSTFLIAIADVAGKSIPAAMLMATFQASLKTLSGTHGSLPELVGRMNGYACSNSQNGRRFTTAFIAEFDPASRRLTYVNAGHNDPILRRQSGVIERLGIGGLPLGIMKDAFYLSGEVVMQPGDWLATFTDGVIEAENNVQQEYGEYRLMTMLNSGVMLSPAMLLNSIMVDLDRFVGDAPQHDDITCILLRAG